MFLHVACGRPPLIWSSSNWKLAMAAALKERTTFTNRWLSETCPWETGTK
jgi:hypothetical protein